MLFDLEAISAQSEDSILYLAYLDWRFRNKCLLDNFQAAILWRTYYGLYEF